MEFKIGDTVRAKRVIVYKETEIEDIKESQKIIGEIGTVKRISGDNKLFPVVVEINSIEEFFDPEELERI